MRAERTPPLIELQDVSLRFGAAGSGGVTGVTLTIERGEFVAVVGPSGAGKSTLLNILGLLDQPQSGEYLLSGAPTRLLRERSRDRLRSRFFGFVFQSSFVLSDESVHRNAALGLRIQGVPLAERSARAAAALDRLGLSQRSRLAARLLSGGERQRLALARALAASPEVVLADEPTGNLDSASGQRVLSDLRRLHARGTTVILVTHDPGIAAAADRRILVHDGRVSAEPPAPLRPEERPGPATQEQPSPDPAPVHGSAAAPRRLRLWPSAADALADAMSGLSHQRRRTVLLALAYGLGVGGLIAATGIGQSAALRVDERIAAAARDDVRVTLPVDEGLLLPDDTRLATWMDRVTTVPEVVGVGFLAQAGSSSTKPRRLSPSEPEPSAPLLVASASPSYFSLMGISLPPGSAEALFSGDIGAVAAVGPRVPSILHLAPPGPGSTLSLNGRQVDVAGEFTVNGERAAGSAHTIFVSRDVLIGAPTVTVSLIVRTGPGQAAAVAEALPVLLDPANPGRFSVETTAQLRTLRSQVSGDLAVVVALLATVMLVLASVSAGTSMLISVRARLPEIALRRALGASRGRIARMFLLEGGIIGTAGGSAGALAGTVTVLVLAAVQGWTPFLTPDLAVLALALGLCTGVVSAALPALTASRQQPSQAIRS